jgi:hypothetical protein
MSLTITLTAQANATLHLRNGEERRYLVEENIPLNETPTEVTNIILGFKTHEDHRGGHCPSGDANDGRAHRQRPRRCPTGIRILGFRVVLVVAAGYTGRR